jgi:hypothetical protein
LLSGSGRVSKAFAARVPLGQDDFVNDRIAAVTAIFVALLLLTAVFAGGGLVMLLVCDHGGPATPETFRAAATTLVALVCVLLGVYAGRRRIRPLAVRVVILAGSLIVAVIAGELLCRQYIPAWPARSLHGVTPQEWAAATRGIVPVTQGPSINSWSQRDRARTLHPAANVRRIAFIGDSFLEEGAAVPVSLATEAKFGRRDLEVINLGVSASGPDEYYDRLRNVGGGAGHLALLSVSVRGKRLRLTATDAEHLLGNCGRGTAARFFDEHRLGGLESRAHEPPSAGD